ncbi:MAG: carbohydrate kinase family protein [Pirellulales bacterium]|nr:carbohydrate kinase family protein [Pirellulales bacterium]
MLSIDCLSVGILVADHLTTPISHVPRAGELVLADDLPVAVGGCAANVALDLARAGVRVATIGCVGADLFGRYLIDALKAGGARTEGIRVADGTHTSQTLIVNVAGEDRRFVHTIGANALLCADDIPLELVRQCKVLYVGGYLLLRSLTGPALAGVFRAARQVGVKTVLDIVLPGKEDCWPALAAVLPETDVFLPNSDEGEALTGHRDPVRQAEHFLAAGTASVVITCGGGGSVLVSRDQRLHAGVYPVTFVGGTGAGDAFDAGFITGMLTGEDAAGCLKWGSALGASCVRGVGATETVFTRDEALEFMRRQKLAIAPSKQGN